MTVSLVRVVSSHPDSTTTYAAAGRGRLRWPAARSTPARCSLAQLSGSHCERGRWSTLTRRRSSRLWLTQAGVRFFSRRGCSIPPRAICSLDARQQPARLLLHLAAADLTGHCRSAQRRCSRLERCDASGVRFGRRTAIRCVRWLDLCFFGCCTTISSFLGLHGYGHPSPQVGLATSVFKPLTNCTSFTDTTFWTVSAQSLPFLYGHLSPRVGLATSVLKPLNNCTRFPDTLFQTVSGSPLRAGCTPARPSVVIPWPFWGASLVEMAWSSARMASAAAGSTPGVASRRSVPPHALLTAAASGASRQRRQREKRAV